LPTDPVLVIHGGAWAMPDDMVDAHIRGVNNAVVAGWRVLDRGGSALDAVEEAVVVMEDDETFDAGRGSFLNRDGRVQLDALIMDGATLRTGGVGCVEHLQSRPRRAQDPEREPSRLLRRGRRGEVRRRARCPALQE
jgi:beta-aspartyl-peptidase (threonine type)